MTMTGLAPSRRRLENGGVGIAKASRATPAVTVSASLRAGSVNDPASSPGLMHFLSRVIDRGTTLRSADEMAELLDSRGVSLNIGVTRHLFSVSCTCLAEDFDLMLRLVAEVVRQPALPDEEVETRRREIVTALRQDQDNPAMVAVEEELALLFPEPHPYGRRLKGTVASVEAVTRDQLLAAHREHFSPSSLAVICVGDVDEGHALDQVASCFGDWAGHAASVDAVPMPAPRHERCRAVFPMMNKAQADIAYGFTAIARRDPSYFPFVVMNNILGQYALGGRLGDSIRERQGMAYYVFSAFEPNVGVGPLVIRAGVNPANVDRAVASIDAELERMVADGVTERELRESRQYLVGSMPRALETNSGIASFLLSAEQFDLGLDFDLQLPGLVDAVTLDQVNEVARSVLVPERAAITIAGPYEQAR